MEESEGSQKYCLRWNNHSSSIISEFDILLGQQDFVDVTLTCDRKSVKAHKVVLSACSTYFRRLLKDNPCQHPIIILRDVGYKELSAILYFMYHGQVMIEQDRIPQLIQTAQLLEIRGLCEVGEGDSSTIHEPAATTDREENVKTSSNSFLAGLLNAGVSATKRSSSVVSDSLSNSSPIPSPVAKRQRNSVGPPRPVPMLQSILSQQVTVPKTPTFDLTKVMGSSTKTLSALVSKAQASNTSSSSGLSISCSNKSLLPSSLSHLLGGLSSAIASSSAGASNGGDNSATNSSFEDINDKDDRPESSYGDMENSSCQGLELVPDTVVEIKEEPLMEFEDFGEDHSSNRGGGRGARTDDDEDDDSESETELRGMSDSSRGEAYSLPLLAQHLAAPNLLSASAKLRAAASQARTVSSGENPSISQVVLSPSTPPDMDSDPLAGDHPPRKLAFHEPRPCPICRRMYRDAATLRTHTAIMHAEGKEPFACLCGELFRTKYEMYNHKKNGHR